MTDQTMHLYALVDAGNAPGFLEMLKTYDPPASCLYNEPLQEGMAELAPYIVELTSEPVKTWLSKLTTPWGLYLISDKANFLKMRKHLRKYTFAIIPIEEKPVFFRFYDPRVFWDLTHKILDDWQLHAFLGPIDIVASYVDGQYRQDSFDERRSQFPNQIRMKTMYITLTEDQYDRFNKIYEERYIDELAEHMMKYVDPNIIKEAENNADKLHREMLEHARDTQGESISHVADQEFLLNQKSSPNLNTPKPQRPEGVEQAYFHFSRQTGEWEKIRGSEVTKVGSILSHALTKLAKTPINENEFHEITNFEYVYLNHQNTQQQSNLNNTDSQNTPSNYNHDKPDYLKAYAGDPYFYEQNNDWYYVDDEGIANPIRDERTEALKQTNQKKVFEDDFHHRTNNRYQHYKGLAYLPEIIEEEDVLEITTMDELKATIHQFAQDWVYYLKSEGIRHERAFKELSKLLVLNGYYRLKDVPNRWSNILINNGKGSKYRAKMLEVEILEEMEDI